MADATVRRWHDMMNAGKGVDAASEMISAQSNHRVPAVMKDPRIARTVWAKNTAIMEKYNERGRFTAFIGYEWTSNAGGSDNLPPECHLPALWLLPVTFPMVMAFGGFLGLVGVALPGVEIGIALRVAGAAVAMAGVVFLWGAVA